jgi:TRAP transporter 4TM/12TM fusion protein
MKEEGFLAMNNTEPLRMKGEINPLKIDEVEEIVERYEGATRKLGGFPALLITLVAIGSSVFSLYAAPTTIVTQMLRGVFVMLTLFLTVLAYPAVQKHRNRIPWFDWALAFLSILPVAYMLWDFEEFIYRMVTPTPLDMVMGLILIGLILEAIRRTAGGVLAVIVLGFLLYAYMGQYLPAPWNHRGYSIDRIVGRMYMTLEGIFGVPIDVAATFIILFTIYGAFLDRSGAGQFFIDFAFSAMGGKPAGAGRTALLASFLLGGPAGSGVAVTVTIGSASWPMLKKVGYSKEAAGGFLAAGGLGAVLSPPVMGAAAFLICEILKISYLEVMAMAVMPTILYYWSIFLMVEFDARRFGVKEVLVDKKGTPWELFLRYGYHFISLITIVIFMLFGFTAILSVFWSIAIVYALSFIRRETALTPRKLLDALRKGTMDVLSVAATCAGAGIIVGVVTLTGLGLQISTIIVDMAGGNLIVTIIYTAIALWVIGLAVPVTGTYIIAVAICAPALIKLGVPDYAAHMFIFYYAVLAEVTPPTALNAFAAAALTGGDPYKTTMLSWKYTLPAFLVPFMFTSHPSGIGLLLKGDLMNIILTNLTALIGVGVLAAGMSGWLFRRTVWVERILLIVAGFILVYPAPLADAVGVTLAAGVAIRQWRTRTPAGENQKGVATAP